MAVSSTVRNTTVKLRGREKERIGSGAFITFSLPGFSMVVVLFLRLMVVDAGTVKGGGREREGAVVMVGKEPLKSELPRLNFQRLNF